MPTDVPGTRFNLAFAVSLALIKGGAGLAEFSMDSVKDPNIQRLFGKIQYISDPSLESKKDNIRGAKLEIHLNQAHTCNFANCTFHLMYHFSHRNCDIIAVSASNLTSRIWQNRPTFCKLKKYYYKCAEV